MKSHWRLIWAVPVLAAALLFTDNTTQAKPSGDPTASEKTTGPLTALDQRRLAYLQHVDNYIKTNGQDNSYPTPNLQLKINAKYHEFRYYEKVLAILGQVDMGQAPQTRIDEANALLRYAMRGVWTANPGLRGSWDHGTRTLAYRVYLLYKDIIDADILAVFNTRFNAVLTGPYDRDTENIKMFLNAGRFLAHEITNNTHLASFGTLKTWLLDTMRIQNEKGYHEWGAAYNIWTMDAVLNLAEFAQDPQIQKLAEMSMDYYLALQTGFTIDGFDSSVGVRLYPWEFLGSFRVQSILPTILFTGNGYPPMEWRLKAVTWAASNYRPLSVIKSIHDNEGPAISRMKTGTEIRGTHYEHYCFRGETFALSTNQSPYYKWASAPHDAVGVYLMSNNGPRSNIAFIGYDPRSTDRDKRKQTTRAERYFGHQNVAIYNTGGVVPSGDPNAGTASPTKLCITTDWNVEFVSGWAFLQNGNTYVAWIPTRGNAQWDSKASAYNTQNNARWIRSSYNPGTSGEDALVEVGDASIYGSYGNFKNEVLNRNSRPRVSGGSVSYTCKNGDRMVFASSYLSVNGVRFNDATWPRADMPGVQDNVIDFQGNRISFDFTNVTTTGALTRETSNVIFGNGTAATPLIGDIWSTAGPTIQGWAYDHESNPTTIRVIVTSSPVHSSAKTLGTIDCDGSPSAAQDSAIRTSIQTNLGVSPPAGYKFLFSEDMEQWLLNHPDTTQSGTYTLRFRLLDQQTGNTLLLENGGSGTKDFPIVIGLNTTPTAPTDPYVGSNESQSGSSGDPVTEIDLTPTFSAVYNDPDGGDTASVYRIQVNTASDFTGTDVWISDPAGDALSSPVSAGDRCADIAYAGSALSYNTRYYWRIIFADQDDEWSPLSAGTHSFMTATGPNNNPTAPTILFVGGTEAQSGTAGNPVTDIDLTPVFSAVFNDDAGDSTTTYRIQVHDDPNFGGPSLWLTDDNGAPIGNTVFSGQRTPDIVYGGDPLSYSTTYYWRLIFRDQGGLWSALPDGTHSFTTVDQPNEIPTAPTSLFVESQSAQAGTAGTTTNPVMGIDLTPVFSAIYNDINPTDIASKYRIQVHTREDFSGPSLWLSPDEGESMPDVNQGNRSSDILYGGSTLSPDTTYFWRIIFQDSAGAWSEVSDTVAFATESTPTTVTIRTDALPDGQQGEAYLYVIEARNGTAPYTFARTSGELPSGLTVATDGTLSGTPGTSTAGDYVFVVEVTDAGNDTDSRQFTLSIAPPVGGSSGGGGGGGGGCVAGGDGNSLLPLLLLALVLIRPIRRIRPI